MTQETSDDTQPLEPENVETNTEGQAPEENISETPSEDSLSEADATVVPEDTIESLKAALAISNVGVKDAELRAQAEIQNIRKRTERDVANAHKFGQEKLIKELLAVVDSLERGIQTIDEPEGDLDPSIKTIRDGSELTLKMLVDTLAKFQVVQIDPAGEPFDPQFHEAMSMIENPDAEPNSVIAVVQKGYTLNDRLIRPAMVVVAK